MKYKLFALIAIILIHNSTLAQSIKPDVQNLDLWEVFNRKAEPIQGDNKKAIKLNNLPADGGMLLKDYQFSNGTIEFDVKGKNVPQQSFVGLAFHIQNKETYDIVYFRPFNFMNADTARRQRAVQYVSMPDYPWEKLRADFPGKYENKVNPVPNADDWFHVKVTVYEHQVQVFVNHSQTPSLSVTKLTGTNNGGLALWVGNNSEGSFANLVITPEKKEIPAYGNNSKVGKYVNVGDAKLYYEVYGSGEPLVLLHGGVYGSIGEFEYFIPKLAQKYQVICIATRGHGKSEIGSTPFTWKQRADDAYRVIREVTKDSVIVLGFSDGANSGLKLAASHPELVKKLIAIGTGDDNSKTHNHKPKLHYTPEGLLREAKDFFESRLQLMPEPERWGECLEKLNNLYNNDFISKETFEKIKCPVLLMNGQHDTYCSVDDLVNASKMIKNNQLSIIPGCDHVVFYCNFPAVWESMLPFLHHTIR